MKNKRDYYDILGVSKEASFEEIQKKYRELVRKYHPDLAKNINDEIIKEINVAYNVLSDKEKRKAYDQKLNNYDNITSDCVKVDYQEEVNKYNKKEKDFAKKIAIKKIIDESIIKIQDIIKAKYNVMELALNADITEDYYLDKIEQWWEVTENYIDELEELKDQAYVNELDFLITPLNNNINSIHEELKNVPLSILDTKRYLNNLTDAKILREKINSDLKDFELYVNNIHSIYKKIDKGFINKDNYQTFYENDLLKQKEIIKKLENISLLNNLYKLEFKSEIDSILEELSNRCEKLPKNFKQAKVYSTNYIVNEEQKIINREISDFIHKLNKMQKVMDSGIENIYPVSEMDKLNDMYKKIKLQIKDFGNKIKNKNENSFGREELRLDIEYNKIKIKRKAHIEEFFDAYDFNKKRASFPKILFHENRLLTGACILTGVGAALGIVSQKPQFICLTSAVITAGINAYNLSTKMNISKYNCKKIEELFENSQETKQEYAIYKEKKKRL